MGLKRTWRKIRHFLYRIFDIKKEPGAAPAVDDDPVRSDSGPTPPALNWCWGGFRGGNAKECEAAQIHNLRVTDSGLSFGWKRGGCENLGASSASDKDNTLACLFLEDGRGGKFDWISTSRRTRDFKNIHAGYQGWSASAFKASKRVWFCICSLDGKRRTNLVCAEKA